MYLHNTKISKILKASQTQYEDRKNGIIRIPSPPVVKKTTKNSKKKKVKKKVNTGIDFTIVVKGEDSKIEEIRVRDAAPKLKKKKAKTAIKEDVEECEKENVPDYESKIAQYMQALENTYQKEKNGKDLKKVKIKASARMIQKAWALFLRRKNILKEGKFEEYDKLDSSVVRKIILIQNWYRASRKKLQFLREIKEKIKTLYFGRKIVNRLQWIKKRRLTIKSYNKEEAKEIESFYTNHSSKIKILQNFITKVIPAKILLKKIDKIYSYQNIKGKILFLL